MLNFSIDSRQKTMQVEVLLKGETLPITVNVQEYEFAEHEGQPAIILRKASASREWVNNVVQQFVVGKPLPLPGKLGPMVKLVA